MSAIEPSATPIDSIGHQRNSPPRDRTSARGPRPERRDGTVLFAGAGATAACGGPVTAALLPIGLRGLADGLLGEEGDPALIKAFFLDVFHLREPWLELKDEQFQAITTVLSLIDLAIERGQPLNDWGPDKLRSIRRELDRLIFKVLEQELRHLPPDSGICHDLINRLWARRADVCIITTNFDIIFDNALLAMSPRKPDERLKLPRYGFASGALRNPEFGGGTLLKLHGSLNWAYCPNCHSMATARMPSSGFAAKEYPPGILEYPWMIKQFDAFRPCRSCHWQPEPVLVSPTYLKNYNNPHLASIWHKAELALRSAKRVVFCGYSLPDDDLEVLYLLKRSLWGVAPSDITVIGHRNDHAQVLRRFRALLAR